MEKSSSLRDQFKDLEYVDLSHLVKSTSPIYTEHQGFKTDLVFNMPVNESVDVKIYQFHMFENAGTHLDSPFHFVPTGKRIEDLDLQKMLNLDLHVIDISDKADKNVDYTLSIDDIKNYEANFGQIRPNSFVAMRSGWNRFYDDAQKYRGVQPDGSMHFPLFSFEAAKFLEENRNIAGIGLDTLTPEIAPNIDVHVWLLSREKYIIENINNLASMPVSGGLISAYPLKIAEVAESPVRLVGTKTKGSA